MLRERIEAVTVCIGYADFLAETAKYNRPLFDRLLVVTTPTDIETRDVCRKYSLDVLQTEDGSIEGDFCKGRLIERGLQHLSSVGWRVHIDADIAMPAMFRHMMQAAQLQTEKIYGCDRVLVKSWDEWQAVLKSGYLLYGQHDYHNRLRWLDGAQVGARWVNPVVGWVPIGFFQLWHSSQDQYHGARIRPYPFRHNDACRTDVQMGLQWDRPKRELLPEIIAVHLESEPGRLGVNWQGRKTRRFGPPVIPGRPVPPS